MRRLLLRAAVVASAALAAALIPVGTATATTTLPSSCSSPAYLGLPIGYPQCRVLQPHQQLTRAAEGYRLAMQGDGNLVLYAGSRALWQTHTYGNPGASVHLQTDGNLMLYSATGKVLWFRTCPAVAALAGSSPILGLQHDRNLVLSATRPGGSRQVCWQSHTYV